MPSKIIHRLVQPLKVETVNLCKPFSNFDYVDKHFGDNNAIRRIFSQARTHEANVLVTEIIPARGLIECENIEIGRSYHDYKMEHLVRLTFWRKFKRHRASQDNYVGYAILKHDIVPSISVDCWHVFESVMPKYKHHHNCVPCSPEYLACVDGDIFIINGVLYCQQNGLNKACAQVALRSLCSLHIPDGELSFERINKLAGTMMPASGLSVPQIRQVLNGLGLGYRDVAYTELDKEARTQLPYQKFLYAGIESGGGALLGFRLAGQAAKDERHIVPFFGHTFNQDTWAPDADVAYFRLGDNTRYVPSESWMSSFIGHDDNFGSNFCVPRLYVPAEQADYVVELLGKGVQYSGVVAEAIGIDYLYSILNEIKDSSQDWLRRLVKFAGEQKAVLRAVAINRAQYCEHLESLKDWEGKKENPEVPKLLRRHILPEYVWLIEVSIPQLFPCNQRKLGEIILNAGAAPSPKRDFAAFVLARFPEQYVLLKGLDGDGHPHFLMPPSKLKSHTPLYSTY